MAKLAISDAARVCRIARSTLQRAIQAGRLSLDPDHRVDTAELLRAGYTLHAARQEDDRHARQAALQDATPRSTDMPQGVAEGTPRDATPLHQVIAALERENTLLRAALDAAATREEDARAHTQAAREERALLLQMLQDAQHRTDRLLDLPRIPPATRPQEAPGATLPPLPRHQTPDAAHARAGDARGAMRRRIVALLQDYPAGLTPREIRDLLGMERSLTDTCLGMRRDGLVQRVGRGRYVVAEPA